MRAGAASDEEREGPERDAVYLPQCAAALPGPEPGGARELGLSHEHGDERRCAVEAATVVEQLVKIKIIIKMFPRDSAQNHGF